MDWWPLVTRGLMLAQTLILAVLTAGSAFVLQKLSVQLQSVAAELWSSLFL